MQFAAVSRIGLSGSLSKQMASRMSSNRGNLSFSFYGFEHLKAYKRNVHVQNILQSLNESRIPYEVVNC